MESVFDVNYTTVSLANGYHSQHKLFLLQNSLWRFILLVENVLGTRNIFPENN